MKIVILSKNSDNLVPLVVSIYQHERTPEIIVVDDGLVMPQSHTITLVPGESPFVFARNANIGITTAFADPSCEGVILLNDDTKLMTPNGFTMLSHQITDGICSAGITGAVGNHEQFADRGHGLQFTVNDVAFVCVYIPRVTYESLGPLDERFTGYGWEDKDYCLRAISAGLKIGIYYDCVVDHSGISSYRSQPGCGNLSAENQHRFMAKYNH